MKILLWVILIIFLIGLLVVTGLFMMIFLFCCPSPRRANTSQFAQDFDWITRAISADVCRVRIS